MPVETSAPWADRLARLRAELERARMDALIVSHPPNLRYLTSFHGSAGALLLLPARTLLVVDFRYGVVARAAARISGCETVIAPVSLDETIVAALQTSGAKRIGVEGQWLSVARFNRLSVELSTASPVDVDGGEVCPVLVSTERLIERARAVKDASEIATLREAGRRLAGVAAQVPPLVREGRTEIEVSADIDRLLREAGFERPAFETIVASGPNGALPHARPGSRRLARQDGVVLDFGGVYDGYCVDLTRTVEVGTAAPEWRRLASAVAEAHRAAIETVRPGILPSAVDAAARDVLARHGLGEAFGHATGHGLGLEVHEEPRIGRPVRGQAEFLLEPGMVFTIEPGAYVEGLGGARLEDDVLVTASGADVLTRG